MSDARGRTLALPDGYDRLVEKSPLPSPPRGMNNRLSSGSDTPRSQYLGGVMAKGGGGTV